MTLYMIIFQIEVFYGLMRTIQSISFNVCSEPTKQTLYKLLAATTIALKISSRTGGLGEFQWIIQLYQQRPQQYFISKDTVIISIKKVKSETLKVIPRSAHE